MKKNPFLFLFLGVSQNFEIVNHAHLSHIRNMATLIRYSRLFFNRMQGKAPSDHMPMRFIQKKRNKTTHMQTFFDLQKFEVRSVRSAY